jgi:hypothetical protein
LPVNRPFQEDPVFREAPKKCFLNNLGGVVGCVPQHFRLYWRIDRDLHLEVIEMNIRWLKLIPDHQPDSYLNLPKEEELAEGRPRGSLARGCPLISTARRVET